MQNPLISVVIPTYNRGDKLRTTVHSVLNQTYRNLELIVVDDCSTLSAAHALASIAREDHRLRIVRHERNQDVSAARNTGLALAQGELIAFLDHDDLWRPEKLARQLAFLIDGVYQACVTDIASNDQAEYNRYNSKKDISWLILTGSFLGMASSMLAERAVFDDVGTFNTRLPALQDWEWLLRFHEKGYALGIVPEPLALYAGAHRRKPEVELADLEFIRRRHIPALPKDECDILDAALRWRQARVELSGQRRPSGAIKLAAVALQRPVTFGRYLYTVYEDALRRRMAWRPAELWHSALPAGNIAAS